MKKLLLLLFIPLISFAQEAIQGEFIVHLTNYGPSWDITFKLTAITIRWDENDELTTDYEVVTDNITNIEPREREAYFEHVKDPSIPSEPVFAISLYKVSAIEDEEEKAHFFMDWRTDDWSASLDVDVDYDVDGEKFIEWEGTTVWNRTYQTVWDRTDNLLTTSDLEDYWENCLAVIPSVNNHPLLVWGPYPPDGVITKPTNYQVWRKYGGLDWYLLDVVNHKTFTYEDDDLSITGQGSGTTVWYKLRTVQSALPNNLLSDYSNTASIVVDGDDPGKINIGGSRSATNKFKLYQNYPNPFNPTTTISYSISKDGLVTIKVFDILGREIATLLNENIAAGTYSINFNASDLPGGIYFYTLSTGSFQQTRKFILLK